MGILEAEKELSNFMAGLGDKIPMVSDNTGHLIASMLIGYRTGFYDRAIGRADKIIARLDGDKERKALKCAVEIIRTHSVELLPSQKSVISEFNWEGGDPTKTYGYEMPEETECRFSGEDKKYYAIPPKKENLKVPLEFERDNALIFAYACAYLSSPEDRLPLEEQVLGHILQRIEYYQKEDSL
ncbi:MAG: hypothetical protein JXQ82_02605 [Methanomicrobiaceae archaeon]|nr:hypothetical protein [Methanomicrobiaceae archaeon]